MNPIEIAARNYVANTCGISPGLVDMMFDTNPDLGKQAEEMVANALNGPYGVLVPLGEVNIDEREATLNGYVTALSETVTEINGMVAAVPCECAALAVHNVLGELVARIRAQIEAVTQPEPEEVSVYDLLKGLGIFVQAA